MGKTEMTAIHSQGRARQAGASLLFALITLVALGLAATALVRAVDTGAIVLGNLSAKKATTIAADRATQRAIAYLVAKGGEAARNNDDANNGYYASAKEDYDITGFDSTDPARKLVNWDIDGSCAYATSGTCDPATRPNDKFTVDAAERLEARWLITRLCSTASMAHDNIGNNCVTPPKVGYIVNQNRGAIDNNTQRPNQANPVPFYRIVVRVTGPRNAVTYTETIVNL